jgi:hypothetical protein
MLAPLSPAGVSNKNQIAVFHEEFRKVLREVS